MIDLGFTILPTDVFTWMAITTACVLAVMYIGFEILSAIGGTLVTVVSLRSLLDEAPLVILDYNVGTIGALILLLLGAYLAYRGTVGFLNANSS